MQIEHGVGVHQQPSANLCQRRETAQPGDLLGGDQRHIQIVAAVAFPGEHELAQALEIMRRQKHDFVVAQQRPNLAADFRRLGLQAHHQIDRAHAVRAAIKEIAHEPQVIAAAAPLAVVVDQPSVG